jgi:uncharacterized protein YraI
MSKLVVVCLCVVSLVALMAASLSPARVLAASATLTVATPLQDSPTPDAVAITLVPEGSVVSIDGPPVEGYYPVTAGDVSGWMPGETLLFEKDETVTTDSNGNPVADESGAVVPEDQPPLDPALGTTPDAELTTDETAAGTASDGSAQAPETGELTDTSTASTDPSTAASPDGSEPLAATDPELVPESGSATPVPLDAVSEEPVGDPGLEELTPDADSSLSAFPDAGPQGLASVATDTPILMGPGAEFGVIISAPGGSAVEQTGHLINGFVTVKFGGITGWVAADHLGPPTAATDAAAPMSADPVAAEPVAAEPLAAEPAATEQTPHERRRGGHRRR